MVVINIDSGPGSAPVPEYLPAIAAARASGADVVAYVDTDNGQRSHGEVVADIDLYREWYGPRRVLLRPCPCRRSRCGRVLLLVARVRQGNRRELHGRAERRHLRERALHERRRHRRRLRRPVRPVCVGRPGTGVALPSTTRRASGTSCTTSRELPCTRSCAQRWSRRTGWLYVTDQAIDDAERDTYLYGRLPDNATWRQLRRLLGSGSS